MATIAEIAVSFVARTRPFEQGTKRASKSLKEFDGVSRRASFSMSAFAAKIGIAATAMVAARKVVGSLNESMRELDRIAKTADRTGFGTGTLQGLEFGAKKSGLEVSTLTRGLEAFNRRLGEARLGTGEARIGLDALNLSADELARMPAIDALGMVADRLNRVGTQAERAGIAAKLFGRVGSGEFLNFLQAGSEGLREFIRQREELGGVFTRDQLKRVEEANDAWTTMTTALQGLSHEFAVNLAPAIQAAAESLTFFIKRTKEIGLGTFSFGAIGSPNFAAAEVAKQVETLEKKGKLIRPVSPVVSPVLETLTGGVQSGLGAINRVGGLLGQGRRAVEGQRQRAGQGLLFRGVETLLGRNQPQVSSRAPIELLEGLASGIGQAGTGLAGLVAQGAEAAGGGIGRFNDALVSALKKQPTTSFDRGGTAAAIRGSLADIQARNRFLRGGEQDTQRDMLQVMRDILGEIQGENVTRDTINSFIAGGVGGV